MQEIQFSDSFLTLIFQNSFTNAVKYFILHLFPIDADQEVSLLETGPLSVGEHSDFAQLYTLNLIGMMMNMVIVMTLVKLY